MSYGTRGLLERVDMVDAVSSDGPSSPGDKDMPFYADIVGSRLSELDMDTLESDDDPTFVTTRAYATRHTDEEKVLAVLQFMRQSFPRFSLEDFLRTMFTSQHPLITHTTHIFLDNGNPDTIMDLWMDRRRHCAVNLDHWVVRQAGHICAKEASHLTNRAKAGPHYKAAQELRIRGNQVDRGLVANFDIKSLGEQYQQLLPSLQFILKAVTRSDLNVLGSETGIVLDEDRAVDEDSQQQQQQNRKHWVFSLLNDYLPFTYNDPHTSGTNLRHLRSAQPPKQAHKLPASGQCHDFLGSTRAEENCANDESLRCLCVLPLSTERREKSGMRHSQDFQEDSPRPRECRMLSLRQLQLGVEGLGGLCSSWIGYP
jgi:hypothetical protein